MLTKRKTTSSTGTATKVTKTVRPRPIDSDEDGYPEFQRGMKKALAGPLFTTSATGLFRLFLANLPARNRQHYNCHACRRFIDTYGGLVSITDRGLAVPVFWDEAPAFFKKAARAIRDRVASSSITGVFLSKDRVLGTPFTSPWHHLSAINAEPYRESPLKTVHQAIAEKVEDYGILYRAVQEFHLKTVATAMTIVDSDHLYRSEKVAKPAAWFYNLVTRLNDARYLKTRSNLIWLAVATAPPGFVHIRTTMIGTLLEDIRSGLSFNEVSRRFREKMNPLQYQRPTAPPTAGNIARAEVIVRELEAKGSLKRRYATLEDVEALWEPRTARRVTRPATGVFSHLYPPPASGSRGLDLPEVKITWEKFHRTVVPGAARMELLTPYTGAYMALVTAVDPNSPPILQWDHEDERNQVSWYFYASGSAPHQWGLSPRTYTPVTAICFKPSMWGSKPMDHQGKGVFFLLQGARDQSHAGLGLFPEILKGEFREIRATIEEFSRRGTLAGRLNSNACGIGFDSKGGNLTVRVTDANGNRATYTLDRWD